MMMWTSPSPREFSSRSTFINLYLPSTLAAARPDDAQSRAGFHGFSFSATAAPRSMAAPFITSFRYAAARQSERADLCWLSSRAFRMIEAGMTLL